jgi:hypothetical protein
LTPTRRSGSIFRSWQNRWLLSAYGTSFVAIGTATKLEFVGFDQSAGIAGDEDGGDGEEKDLDFSMKAVNRSRQWPDL